MTIRPRSLVLTALALALSALSLAPSGAFGENQRRSYGFRVGYWIPTETLIRDALGSGVAFGGTFSLPLRSNRWIDFQLGYWSGSGDLEPLEYETIPGAVTYRTSDMRLIPLSLSLRFEGQPLSGVKPFILGGVDLNSVREEVAFRETTPGEPDNTGTNTISNAFLGFHVGGGAETDLRPTMSLFAEGRVSIVNADTEGVGGLLVGGVSLGGVWISGGLRFK